LQTVQDHGHRRMTAMVQSHAMGRKTQRKIEKMDRRSALAERVR
jgi:hypothetical protein